MAPKPFQFKQFSVADDRCTHKVGTDGVLLGSWVQILKTDELLLDVGTGSGVIALMLAQRSMPGSMIDAIEIEEDDARQARMNVLRSPWRDRINVVQTSLQVFHPQKSYDLIVSNPPYFVNSLLPPERKRTQARHTQTLSFNDLLTGINRLLAPTGRFALILPFTEGSEFLLHANRTGLHPRRVTRFLSRKHKAVERLLIELSKEKQTPDETELILYDQDGGWTDDYRSLTRDFYLKA